MPASDYVTNLRAKVGHDLVMFPTVSAVVLNDRGEVLLGQRSDNHRWALIAGLIDPGEQPAEALVREVLEETAVQVKVERLAGIALHEVTYPNGDHCHMVNTWFRCRAIGGEARVNDAESIAVGWFALDDLPELTPFALQRIRTALDDGAPAWFAQPGESIDGVPPR
ncbi:NUDIX hydrolase [Pseudosporangium ferrugineum]|uniref:8-oxo-dGTP diphosphatase n=1 Tax=Pseudosporangium ferrugineum TaxID=439699 RepID=A0A2T0RL99_9ACTN|nr:NUDIX domain-containing protein [Pseudosporangium ferrugineum]PRY21938.1 8-oxo-dGTP diphosphatase [Pseudosporangium ferrugineum]